MAIPNTKDRSDKNRKIIVKRRTKEEKSRLQGTWKIAYADFVTALMAFFLLMWLTSTLTLSKQRGVAEYFRTPLSVALSGGVDDTINTSVITGGDGQGPTQMAGQVKRGELPPRGRPVVSQNLKESLRHQEVQRLEQLKSQLEQVIDANPQLGQYKNQLLIDMTTDGLRIQIVDEQNRPMFEKGGTALQPYTMEILHAIGKTLNEVPNKIGLSGHTDATPYQGGSKGYSNWELSADRANSSRRELIAGGMDPGKILRVVGLSDSALLNPDDPYDANNRRISIIVMNREAEESASTDGGVVNMDEGE